MREFELVANASAGFPEDTLGEVQGSSGVCCLLGLSLLVRSIPAQESGPPVPVHLSVREGTPLRLYLTERVFYKTGAPVRAKFIAPVWSFDRITIPAGASAEGTIVSLIPIPKFARAMSMVRGDFTPLKQARVVFSRITLPDGRGIDIYTESSNALGSFYVEPKPPKKRAKSKPPSQNSSTFATVKTLARQQAENFANSRSQGLFGIVHAPNRKQWLQEFLLLKLPYHPQWYGRGACFNAVLTDAIDFGTAQVPGTEFSASDAQPAREQSASLRLTDTMTSADAKAGDPIHGILAEPLFTPAHQLILPEGTDFSGKVTLAKPARYFHRGGKLRFTFNQITTRPEMAHISKHEGTQSQMTAVQQGKIKVIVDEEGTAKTTESKSRFLRPIIAGLVAAKSLDNDQGKAQTGANANYSGRALGGFSGFGLFGTFAVFAPKNVGAALGFYGLGWSAYSAVIARGQEVKFSKNAAIQIRFATRK